MRVRGRFTPWKQADAEKAPSRTFVSHLHRAKAGVSTWRDFSAGGQRGPTLLARPDDRSLPRMRGAITFAGIATLTRQEAQRWNFPNPFTPRR